MKCSAVQREMGKEGGKSLVDYTTKFHNSLKEMREFSSQLYNAADYWKSSFLKSQDKKLIIESSKHYISEALLITIDHLGCLSHNLSSSLSATNAIPQTQHKIQNLKQRIGRWQDYPYKLGLPCRFQFPRYHCRYISFPLSLKDSRIMNGESSESCCIDAEGKKQLKYLHTWLPVEDSRLSALPKAEHSTFQFQEAQKPKRGAMKWKRMQKKEIASVIKRTKRILT
ncbi:hypothetical protein ACS0TY_026906 [Phlomoides rotata]